MATIQSAIKRLAKAPGKTLSDPRKPEKVSGTTGLMTWPQENAAQSAGGAATESQGESVSPSVSLSEISGTRTYHPAAYITDPQSLQTAKVKPLKSCQATDANGTVFTVNFANPYT